jgi:hypothetical protein
MENQKPLPAGCEPAVMLDEEKGSFEKRKKEVTKLIIEAAIESKNDLKSFLKKIVEIGAEKTEAKSCVIFLLKDRKSANERGQYLRLYASSGDLGHKLETANAWYYVPQRDPFTENGTGKKKVLALLERYFREVKGETEEQFNERKNKLKSQKKTLIDALREEPEPTHIVKVVEELAKHDGTTLEQLVESGELPMGINAWVVKTGGPFGPSHLTEIREFAEWRGSYEGIHGICTSVVDVALEDSKGDTLGKIKIENHRKSDVVQSFEVFEQIEDPSNKGVKNLDDHDKKPHILCFTKEHKELLEVLADSVTIAIEKILYSEDVTYKKYFGIELLKKINELTGMKGVNKDVHDTISEFYEPLEVTVEDIFGIEKIYDTVATYVTEIAQDLNLQSTSDLIDNIGPAFESLLGTDVRYREHFIHQFQVFLLGYYLINEKESLQQLLIQYLHNHWSPNCNMDDVIRVWFITSMFHDCGYSVGTIEDWLEKYFSRVAVPAQSKVQWEAPTQFKIEWAFIYSLYECEKTRLIEVINRNCAKPMGEIAEILKKAFIEKHDHGMISALLLMQNLQSPTIDENILKEAGCAVALHTENVYSQFDRLTKITDFPFAFLLVFCDNAQQWGRPRIMSMVPELEVKLDEIGFNECTKVKIELRYAKLTSEQKRLVETNVAAPTKYWYSERAPRFSIGLYEKAEEKPFREYIFPHT